MRIYNIKKKKKKNCSDPVAGNFVISDGLCETYDSPQVNFQPGINCKWRP